MSASTVIESDLLVIGAGPAGASAAIAAAQAGLAVSVLDEADAAGGQVWRAPALPVAPGARTADDDEGDALRAALAASGARCYPGRQVLSANAGYRVDALGPNGLETFAAPRVVAATGAVERVAPFPGWTLPGVTGLAAATILLKAQGMLPGRRTVVAGCGPLLLAVAAKILAAGGEVAAVVDLASRRDWLAATPGLAARPALLARGLGWALKCASSGAPVLFRHAVVAAEGGAEGVARVGVAPVDRDGAPRAAATRWFDADALVVGHGLTPGCDLTRLLRARHVFEDAAGGWSPERDRFGRTSISGLFAVGDGAAVAGAETATLTGALAGLAAAHDAGALDAGAFEAQAAPLLARAARARRFAASVARLARRRPSLYRAIAPDTVLCRCEDLRRRDIDAAIDAGATDINQLKHFTRCGMGPCQGRVCGEAVAETLAARVGGREAAGFWTMRPPLRPAPLGDLLGDFSYDDIPVPKPAPL